MLFAVKNHLLGTLLLLVLFVAVGIGGRDAWELTWDWDLRLELVPDWLLGFAALAASDGILHGALVWALGASYLSRYRELVEYFRPQRTAQILAGGLLAGGEELVFRGALLEGLRERLSLSAAAAVAISALAFGILHIIPRRTLWPFGLWAVWEGTLLGTVYVLSGSLLVVVVLHVLHDLCGFALFAYQRRTGWLL